MDDASYRSIELPEERLKGFFSGFRVGGFDGVNITIPHKASVFGLLDEVDSKAKLINAVNCISRTGNRLTGYNTDLLGFAYSLRHNGIKTEGQEFAIIGAGGSALAVGVALAEGNVKAVTIVNRTPEHSEQLKNTILEANKTVTVTIADEEGLIERAKHIQCVVNTTPVGMSPNTSKSPISSDIFTSDMVAFDLIYNPKQTQFLAAAEQAGAQTINGLEMLVAQAVYSVEIWMGGNVVTHVDTNALVRDTERAIK